MDDYMTIKDFAQMYQVSTKTIRRWIAKGDLPGERLPGGRLIRIDVASVPRLTTPVSYISPIKTRNTNRFHSLGEVLTKAKNPRFVVVDLGVLNVA